MSSVPRYAIYYVPAPDDELYRFGAGLLGYDALTGHAIDPPAEAKKAFADWHELTAEPRIYGFHATLKAPITLARSTTEAALVAAFDRFAEAARIIPAITPVVRPIGRFIAVVPNAPAPALAQLADDCVREFDAFRAPLTERDRQRRLKSPLTARQIEYLDRWGYPYVFEEFRFHMTLTGPLADARREAVLAFLQEWFAKLHRSTQRIDHLALLRQDESGSRFVTIKQAKLVPLT